MPDQTERYGWLIRLVRIVQIGLWALLGLAMIATIGKGVLSVLEGSDWLSLAPWVLAFVTEVVLVGWVFLVGGVLRVIIASEVGVSQCAGRLARVEALLENVSRGSERLIELSSLSDQAKSLIFRERELEALHEVINEDLMRQDYKTAAALVDSIEMKFGYADEAARLREEIETSRKATIEEKIDAAVRRVQSVIDKRDWDRATRETQRLRRLFPDNAKVQSLPERIETARTAQKRRLLQAYDEAAIKNDVERGVVLLKELDQYLTPQEAAALAESARGVFRAKLSNLGVQFAICVTDQQWAKAVATGEEIIRSFPNSRMAHEVRAKMDQLRSLAMTAASNARKPNAGQ